VRNKANPILVASFLCLSSLVAAGCGGGGGSVGPSSAGADSFFVTWEIHSVTFGPIDCASAGATEVDLDMVNADSGVRFVDRFACEDYQGRSGPVDVGRFDVLVILADPTGAALSQVDVGTENVSAAGTLDLGHVIFQVD
jgi:hypothetical protein